MGIPDFPECLMVRVDENRSARMPVNLATMRLA
jgi:hypothetical protein